jgi:heptosyltransferase-3
VPADAGKILVIRGGAIGDFILTLPALTALRETFPNIHLEVLGYPHIAQLALAGGLADQVRSIDARAMASFFAKNGPLPESLTEYFAGFALIVSYLYDPDHIFQENVGRASKAQFLVGSYRPDEQAGEHAARVFLRPLERLAIFDADPVPRLTLGRGAAGPSDSELPLATGDSEPFTGPWVALHPGSGSQRKNWPESSWAALLRILAEQTALGLLLVGGEAEGDRLRRLSAPLPQERVRVLQSAPLTEVARVLQRAAAFVGHDSGISHLAGALGLPGLVLWGETNPEIWRPQGEQLHVLRWPAGLSALPPATVWLELQPLLR